MPQRFRKKPVVVEAVKFTGKNDLELAMFVGENGYDPDERGPSWVIRTLEGEMRCDVGDWIVKGAVGEFYPVKPDAFEATFEPI